FLALDAKLGRLTKKDKVRVYGKRLTVEVKKSRGRMTVKVKGGGKSGRSHRTFPVPFSLDEETGVHFAPWSQDRFLCVSAVGAKFTLHGKTFYVIDANMNRVLGEVGKDGFAGPNSRTLQRLGTVCWTDQGPYDMAFETNSDGEVRVGFEKAPYERPEEVKAREGWTFANAQRQRIDSAPLTWDEKLAKGCLLHIRYCIENKYAGHFQDPEKPGYTAEGAAAGAASVLGFNNKDPRKSVLEMLRTAYHAAAVIDPRVKTSAWVIEDEVFCWDVGRGRVKTRRAEGSEYRKDVLSLWPPHGAEGVYTNFNPDGEAPMPVRDKETRWRKNLGQVAFVKVGEAEGEGFYNLVLTDPRGGNVEGFLTTPLRPVYTGQVKGVHFRKNGGLVCLAPKKWLKPRTKYTATLYEGDFYKKKLIFSWSFTTGSR
ncbi:MAG: CAP domain-containing protein, partial [Planctomycetota bacterium]